MTRESHSTTPPLQPAASPSVQVCCRFRPQNSLELNQDGAVCCAVQAKPTTVAQIDLAHQADKQSNNASQYAQFTFDHVFNEKNSSQRSIYETVVAPLVSDTLAGFNCTVIAYGQTGSGKTHTMEGPENVNYNDDEA